MRISREQLYEEVWAEPMVQVAKKYSVSSSYMARICTRLRIPHPDRGYWALHAVGKASAKPALPPPRPGGELEWSRDGTPPRIHRVALSASGPVPEGILSTPRGRSRHGLVLGAQEAFADAKVSDTGYLTSLKKRVADIVVSPAKLTRALSVANTIYQALESSGHPVTIATGNDPLLRPDLDDRVPPSPDRYRYGRTWSPHRATLVYIGNVAIGLTLFETSEYVQAYYVDGKYVRVTESSQRRTANSIPSPTSYPRDIPSGYLCLRASSPYPGTRWERRWCESKDAGLVDIVPQIVHALEAEAPKLVELVAEAKRQAEIERLRIEEEHQRWRREEEVRLRAQHRKESTEELFAIIDAWGVATQIERFFEDAERRAATLGVDEAARIRARLQYARSLVGSTDALQRFHAWKAPEERGRAPSIDVNLEDNVNPNVT